MSDASCTLIRVALEDLPKHSSWPKRLLSLEPYAVRRKTEAEVRREYDDEKWADLVRKVQLLPNPTLADVEQAYTDIDAISPCYYAGCFYLASQRQVLSRHLDLYAEVLKPHVEGATCIAELGAGYGSKLFGLELRDTFASLPLLAGEYTENGRKLLSLLGQSLNRPVSVGGCDFWNLRIDDLAIPEGAVIFTSYALHYVPELSKLLVDFLCSLRPKAVVHFEPCYEHYSVETLHGLMCRRYVELNDYTLNLAGVIEAGCHSRDIAVRTRPNVLGGNPFLPISVIEWAPGNRSGRN